MICELTAEERAVRIVRILSESFQSREGPFADTKELLENQIPRGVAPRSQEHANFLFYLISQDHGVKSARLYERAIDLHSQRPYVFDPSSVIQRFTDESEPGLVSILRHLAVRYPVNGAKFWFRNSLSLCRDYGADARMLFGSDDASAIMSNIRRFYGFGPKTSGLLFRVFVGIGIANPLNNSDVDIPTDIHDTRIAALTMVAEIPTSITEKTYMPYVERAEKAWKRASLRENVDWLQLDRALWILGSKACAINRHHDCPIGPYCIRGNGDQR